MSQETGAFDDSTKEIVKQRSKGRCERCGGAGSVWHFHHRRPRGMGGTSRGDSGGAANALLLHPQCHEWIERNRAAAYDLGLLVAQTDDSRQVSVRLWDGWWLLAENGDLSPVQRSDQEPGTDRPDA